MLTILFTNSEGIDVTVWASEFQSTGIADMALVPSFTSTPTNTLTWPTLGSMISSGKRVIIFLDAGADRKKVDYILPEFDYAWETAFDQTDPTFPCTVDRPASLKGKVPTGRLSIVNHYLDKVLTGSVLIPATESLNVTNALNGSGSLGAQLDSCATLHGTYPNFLLVDCTYFQLIGNWLMPDYDVHNGSVFEVAAAANGVPYIPSRSVLQNAATNTSSPSPKGVPSAAEARKVLPVFIVMQLGISIFTIGGALWLAREETTSKYERLREDRATTLIPAKVGRHQKHDSIASVESSASDTPFATELEGGSLLRGPSQSAHIRSESTTDLVSHGALMGTSSRRGSVESLHSLDDTGDISSLRRMLNSPRPRTGYLEHRKNSLFLD